MKITFLENTFEKGKKTPDIYRKGQTYDLADELAHEYIDEAKAVKFEAPKEEKAEKKTKEEKADK